MGVSAALFAAEVRAEQPASSGTGIIVNTDGHVVTNAHVVTSCGRVSLRTAGGTADATVIAKDARNDIAVLKAKLEGVSPAPLRTAKIRTGEAVVVFGYPLSTTLASSGNVTTGIIAALSGMGDDTSRMQISAPVQPGNSGGPVMDAGGRVIGIVVSKLDAITAVRNTGDIPQNVNFAIKSAMVTAFLSANDIPFDTVQAGDDRAIPDVVDTARAFTVKVECFSGRESVAQALPSRAPPEPPAAATGPQPKPKPDKPTAKAKQPLPYATIDNLATVMAGILKERGFGEAARGIEDSYHTLLSDKSTAKEVVMSAVAIDFAVFVVHVQARKTEGLTPWPFFTSDSIMSRTNTLLDTFSFPKSGRQDLIKNLIDAGSSALAKHLR